MRMSGTWVAAAAAVGLVSVGGVVGTGCAEGTVEFDGTGGSTASSGSGATSPGGGGGNTTSSSSGNGGSGGTSPCAVDCTQIKAPECQLAQCNAQTGQCEVVPDADGTACEDGLFCTIDDACLAGQCEGGPQNDCGLQPGDCDDVTCDETAQSCSTTPKPNGGACTDSNNLCQINTTCQNGLCIGDPKDCFFSPVPDDCHISQCNPQNGQCEPVPGNEGQSCVDQTDLCTVNQTCAAGVCQGGGPKDCSQLTQGCVLGVCDPQSGQCITQGVNDGDPCDDLDSCTSGEICQSGSCAGGTPITQCVDGDQCCPPNCNQSTDADCSCNTNLALSATAAVNPGGGSTSPYDPGRMNNGVGENCSEWAWMNNDTNSPGWATLTWSAQQTIGSMFIDGESATAPACNSSGRDIASAQIQYLDSQSNWVTVGSISGQENYMFTLPSPVTTTALRINNALTSPGNGNSIIHEWYVWPGVGCATPTPN